MGAILKVSKPEEKAPFSVTLYLYLLYLTDDDVVPGVDLGALSGWDQRG
jgi:hypothetical protein